MRDFPIRSAVVRPGAVVRWGTGVVARTPRDLAAVVGFVVLSVAALIVADVSSTLARAAVGFPLLFLAPGYVVVSVLFPRRMPVGSTDSGGTFRIWQARSITDRERVALSFGLSFAVLPLLGLAIAVAPWPYGESVVVGTVGCFALLGAVVAAVRRLRIPESVRYRPQFGRKFRGAYASVFGADSAAGIAVNLALVLSVVIAASTVGFALVSPQEGERYTNAQLLTENESGELVASGYPSEMSVGESADFVLALDNHERERADYEVVVVLDRVDQRDGGSVVVEREELQRFETTLEDGERWTHRHEIAPGLVGDDLRVSYLVYEGEAPATPSAEDAYRHLYFWTDVTDDADGTDAGGETDDGDGGDGEADTGADGDDEDDGDDDSTEDDGDDEADEDDDDE